MSINPSEPKIYFKGSVWFDPQYLEKICIDYHNKKIRGSLRYSDTYIQLRDNYACRWFKWNDPNIIMKLNDQEEQYG